jgi:hypothetical protein
LDEVRGVRELDEDVVVSGAVAIDTALDVLSVTLVHPLIDHYRDASDVGLQGATV